MVRRISQERTTATGGTTPRTFADRFADKINAYDRCVGDGSTNDSAAFVTMLGDAMSSGKPVDLGNRTYALTGTGWSTIVMTGDLTIYADGATLVGTTARTVFNTRGYRLTIVGRLTFSTWKNVISFTGDTTTTNVIDLAHCYFTGVTDYAIGQSTENLSAGFASLRLYDCEITGGLSMVTANVKVQQNALITFCRAYETIRSGFRIGMEGADYQRFCTNARVLFCDVEDMANPGTTSTNGIKLVCYDGEITGCYLNEISNSNGADNEAIYAKIVRGKIHGNTVKNGGRGEGMICIKGGGPDLDLGGDGEFGYQTEVTNNNVSCTDAYAASGSMVGISLRSSRLRCAGNTTQGAFVRHISPQSTSLYNVTIEHNRCLDVGYETSTPGTWAGAGIVVAESPSSAVVVQDNEMHLRTGAIGIRAMTAQDTVDTLNVRFERNRCYGAFRTGLYINPNSAGAAAMKVVANNNLWSGCIDGLRLARAIGDLEALDNVCENTTGFPFSTGTGTQEVDSAIEHKRMHLRGIWKATTTDATATPVLSVYFDDGVSAAFDGRVLANQNTGAGQALYRKSALIKCASGATSIVGAVASTVEIESDANWNFTFTVSNARGRVVVTGVAATTINWEALVEIKALAATA